MEKFLRYEGVFASRTGVLWRVELWQDADAPWPKGAPLEFDSDEGLVIEWPSRAKEEVICGSMATLHVISPDDRTFEDLYTVEPGRIRMDVYRENILYWRGTIDTEFYEEPYERLEGYTVALTFSDLGVLDRLDFGLRGMCSLRAILSHALELAGITLEIDSSLITSGLPGTDKPLSLDDLKVSAENFYDEEGEPLSLKETVEGVLLPLGLRIIQRCGCLYVHDLNGLYLNGRRRKVKWMGTSQTLGVDRTYNNLRTTWNTYCLEGNILPTEIWEEEPDPQVTALNQPGGMPVPTDPPAVIWSYHAGSDPNDFDIRQDPSAVGFTLWTRETGSGLTLHDSHARFFTTVPQNDGSQKTGVALRWPGLYMEPSSGLFHEYIMEDHGLTPGEIFSGSLAAKRPGAALFSTGPVTIPRIDEGVELRVAMEILVDPRINYHNEASDFHTGEFSIFEQKKNYEEWEHKGNFLYLPVRLVLEREDGRCFCWDNRDTVSLSDPLRTLGITSGMWREDTDGSVWGWLAFYDTEDRTDTSGVLGWKCNRPAINPHTESLSMALCKSEGQYIPYPPGGGSLRMEVLSGWALADTGGKRDRSAELIDPYKCKWVMCALPQIEVVSPRIFDRELHCSDIEYSSVITEGAREPLELDMICGTWHPEAPTARGVYCRSDTGEPLKVITRAGRTGRAEELLAGTLFSQYGGRRTTLAGEMEPVESGLVTLSEWGYGGSVFMLSAEVQDLAEAISEGTLTEIRPDEYDRRDQ